MTVKPKKTTKARTAKKAKKPATKATVKKARKAKKPAAKKPAVKTSPAKKTAKQQGKPASAKKSTKNPANKRVAKTAQEKTAWKISPEISQSVVDVDIWKKGDLTIEHRTVYRSGWIIVNQLPDLSGYNLDEGINIFEEFEFEEHEVLDGSQETSLFPKELLAEECERLMSLSEAELEDEGWTIEFATRFSGPLVVEEV
jgi:hypothetical protein